MEVKVGVQHAPREIVLESSRTADEVRASVLAALSEDTGTLELVDEHGRVIIVPAAKVAYVEIGETNSRKVGFGAM